MEILCKQCGTSFHVPPARSLSAQFCSLDCRRAWNAVNGKSPIQQTCKQCGKIFLSHASNSKFYCSRECKGVASRRVDARNCEYCRKEFTCIPSQNTRFCSRKCGGLAYAPQYQRNDYPIRICEECGKAFKWINDGGHGKGRFCSHRCAIQGVNGPRTKTRVTKMCEYCGKTFTYRPDERIERKFCSSSCAALNHIKPGEDNIHWKPRVSLRCEQCGKEKEVQQCKVKRFRFCSPACRRAWILQNMPRVSRIEYKMADAFARIDLHPEAQYIVGFYSLDFAFTDQKLVVECDGDYWHSLPKQQARDKAKEAYLRNKGWVIFRLTETDINLSPDECASRVQAKLQDLTFPSESA